jgi:hypothetical protein
VAEPDTRSASVFVDELDAGLLEGAFDGQKSGSTRLVCAGFELADGDNTDQGFVGQLLLSPIKEPARSPALFWRDHHLMIAKLADSINSVGKQLTPNK